MYTDVNTPGTRATPVQETWLMRRIWNFLMLQM